MGSCRGDGRGSASSWDGRETAADVRSRHGGCSGPPGRDHTGGSHCRQSELGPGSLPGRESSSRTERGQRSCSGGGAGDVGGRTQREPMASQACGNSRESGSGSEGTAWGLAEPRGSLAGEEQALPAAGGVRTRPCGRKHARELERETRPTVCHKDTRQRSWGISMGLQHRDRVFSKPF